MLPKSPLRALSDLISEAVKRIDDRYAAAGCEFPPLTEIFDPKTLAGHSLLSSPENLKDALLISSAADQLTATAKPPNLAVVDYGYMHILSSCLSTVISTSVPEILREAGPKGLHVKEIGAINGLDSSKLARILRLLATKHIFTEVEPDVFANNRISSVLDTLKPTSELLPVRKNNVDHFVETNGVAALVGHSTELLMKVGTCLTENLVDPKTSHSQEPNQAPLNLAFNTNYSFYEWMNQPGNEFNRVRFDIAMHGTSQVDDSILRGFPWESLSDGSKVVDVGGGVGAVLLPIAKQFPKLKFVVQDMNTKQTEKFWSESLPGSVESQKITIQNHNFFEPQPIQDADVFLLRSITHNWSSAYAIKILKQLRASATAGKTKLLIVDQVVKYACKGTTLGTEEIPGAIPLPAPEPLLPNSMSDMSYFWDIVMLYLLNGQERTVADHVYVTKESGWKITRIYSPPGSYFQHIVAEAV